MDEKYLKEINKVGSETLNSAKKQETLVQKEKEAQAAEARNRDRVKNAKERRDATRKERVEAAAKSAQEVADKIGGIYSREGHVLYVPTVDTANLFIGKWGYEHDPVAHLTKEHVDGLREEYKMMCKISEAAFLQREEVRRQQEAAEAKKFKNKIKRLFNRINNTLNHTMVSFKVPEKVTISHKSFWFTMLILTGLTISGLIYYL